MQAGDHLESQRLGYTHHGLYIGAGRVIHYAGLSDLFDWDNAAVQEVSLAEFEAGNGSSVLPHSGAEYSREQSIQRAEARLGDGRYKSCEHFVHWCISGQNSNEQLEASSDKKKLPKSVIEQQKQPAKTNADKPSSKQVEKKAKKETSKALSSLAQGFTTFQAGSESYQIWNDPKKALRKKTGDTTTAIGTVADSFLGADIGSIASSSLVRGFCSGVKNFFKGLFGGGGNEAAEAAQLQQRMQEIAGYNPQMGTELEQGFQDFLRQGAREQSKLRTAYEQDYAKLESYAQLSPEDYAKTFGQISQELGHYAPEINQEVEKQLVALQAQISKIKDLEKNSKIYKDYQKELRKLQNWHVDALSKGIKIALYRAEEKFCQAYKAKYLKNLEQKIGEYEQTRETLETLFGHRHGKLWDRSQGMLNRAGFDLLEQYRKLAEDPAIQELIAELGRMREAEKEYEKTLIDSVELRPMKRTVPYFREEVVGVSIGGELAHVLPSEYSLLSTQNNESAEVDETDELLELLFYKKLSEQQLNIYEFTSIETDYASHHSQKEIEREKPSKKGPFILCVDTSGSMQGTPERVAKTLAFIILRTALAENRKCLLMNFGDSTQIMDLTEISQSLQRLMEFLAMSFHAGNSVEPVAESLKLLNRKGFEKADVVIVSDFYLGDCTADTTKKMKTTQDQGTKFHSVVIGPEPGNSELSQLFDSEWHYKDGWNTFGFGALNKSR